MKPEKCYFSQFVIGFWYIARFPPYFLVENAIKANENANIILERSEKFSQSQHYECHHSVKSFHFRDYCN